MKLPKVAAVIAGVLVIGVIVTVWVYKAHRAGVVQDKNLSAFAQWVRVSPVDGHFSIDMPGRPDVKVTRQPLVQHSVIFERETGPSFTAIATEFPPNANTNVNPVTVLTQWRDKLVQQEHIKLSRSSFVTLRGFSGIEFAGEMADNGPMLFRCFIVEGRMFTLWAAPVAENAHSPEVQHFFDSLKFD